MKKVSKPKKVLVIGGGIAGMQAAKVAGQRGHSVTLYEATEKLGGQWYTGSLQPGKERYRNLIVQLSRGLEETGVTVVLNKKADLNLVKAEKPDAVIVATGAKPLTLDIPVADGANVVQATDVFTDGVEVGQRVVVIGGRMLGMEVACHLAEKGKHVSLMTLGRLGENGRPLEDNIYRTLRDRMIELAVQIFPGTPAVEIRPDGVFGNDGGNLLWLPADTVVLAVGYQSDDELPVKLKGIVPELYTAGDCNTPRDGLEATREGMEVGQVV